MNADAVTVASATIAQKSRSFSLAARLLPADVRDQVMVVYTWCRRADDAVDGVPPAEQPGRLAGLRHELATIYAGRRVEDPVLEAFRFIVEARRIPQLYPEELLAGMEMDVRGQRYATWEDLLQYCHRVAGTVGLMMCHVLGLSDDKALVHAAHLGIGMQLTNICRDVQEDWELGRMYLPRNLLQACHLGHLWHQAGDASEGLGAVGEGGAGWGPVPFSPDDRRRLAQVLRFVLAEADRYYRSGHRGLSALHWRSGFAVQAASFIYRGIGKRLHRQRFDVRRRAVVPAGEKILYVGQAGLLSALRVLRTLPEGFSPAGTPPPPSHQLQFPQDVLPL